MNKIDIVKKHYMSVMRCNIQHYDPSKYWHRREYVRKYVPPSNALSQIFSQIKLFFYLYYIKRCDAFNNASMGTNIGSGAYFVEIPHFPHGMYGIIIAQGAHIGRNCTIFQGVTIGNDNRSFLNVPSIGDNVTLYPGAKVIGRVNVGNNVEIGANAVVVKDVPPNTLVVCERSRYIDRSVVK